jgi:diaminopimelate epimerase
MKKIAFSKMHGLGNDFIIVDALRQPAAIEKAMIAKMADRNQGIGFDQLLLLLPSHKADLCCQIFNADGTEAEQCGNGMRAVARYVHEQGIYPKKRISIETRAGVIEVDIRDYEQIRANMGVPEIKPEPLLVTLDGSPVALTLLSMGNPHAIQRVASCKEAPVAAWGAKIESLPAFPRGVNAGFVEVVDRHAIRLRTYERGVGETLACGSNACASVVAGITQGWLDSPVTVALARGNLQVEWAGENQAVFLTGPATRVFSGEIEL